VGNLTSRPEHALNASLKYPALGIVRQPVGGPEGSTTFVHVAGPNPVGKIAEDQKSLMPTTELSETRRNRLGASDVGEGSMHGGSTQAGDPNGEPTGGKRKGVSHCWSS
jgi:hypothetical protein